MEFLKRFSWDIQRHGEDNKFENTDLTISGLTAGTAVYYKTDGSQVTSTAAATPVIRAVLTANGTFELTYGSLNGTAFTDDGANSTYVRSISMTASSGDAAYTNGTAGDAGDVVGTTVTMTSATGKAITTKGLTYYAADNSTATVTFGATAAASTLDAGSVKLSNSKTDKSIKVGNEVVTVNTAGSFVLSSTGSITNLEKSTVVFVGNDATLTNGHTYTVSADGLSVTVAGQGTGSAANNGVWYLTSALVNASITLDGTVNGVDTISNAGLTNTVGVSVNTTALSGFVSGTTNMYVYRKNATTFLSGYVDSTLGDQIGVLTPDGNGAYTYDASSSTSAQTIDNTVAESTVTKVIGSGKNDTIDFGTTAPNHAVTIDGGAGADTITLGAVYSGSSVAGGAGKDAITVTDGVAAANTGVFVDGGDDADTITITKTSATNAAEWTVSGGAGDDVFDLSGITAGTATNWSVVGGDGKDSINASGANLTYSTIDAGAGDDTIIAVDATNTLYGGSGSDVFDLNTGTAANIGDYTYGEDVILTADANEAALIATAAAGALTTDGAMTLGGKNATVTSSAGFFVTTLQDVAGSKDKIDLAWVKEDATSIDGSSLTRKAIIKGTTNSEGDLLVGGSKADTSMPEHPTASTAVPGTTAS